MFSSVFEVFFTLHNTSLTHLLPFSHVPPSPDMLKTKGQAATFVLHTEICHKEIYGSFCPLGTIIPFYCRDVLRKLFFLLSSSLMDTSLIIENLAREGKLQEARRAGEDALAADPLDDRVLSALVSVYLEIESMCITNKVTCYLDDIAQRLDQLLAMVNDGEKSRTRHRQLLMKMQPEYETL